MSVNYRKIVGDAEERCRKIIFDAINEEDRNNPLTDIQLYQMLKDNGYLISRRTIAKYREQLGFPIAKMRKE